MGAAASSAPAAAAAEGGGVTVGGAPRLVNFLFFSLFFSLKLFRVRVGPVCCFEGLKRGMRAAEFKPHCLRPFSLSLSLSLNNNENIKLSGGKIHRESPTRRSGCMHMHTRSGHGQRINKRAVVVTAS